MTDGTPGGDRGVVEGHPVSGAALHGGCDLCNVMLHGDGVFERTWLGRRRKGEMPDAEGERQNVLFGSGSRHARNSCSKR